MHAQYAEQGLKIIAVNVDADRDEANEFLVDHPAKFEVIYDPEGGLAEKFNIQGMPGVVLITRSGEVFSQYIGFQNERVKHYEESIKKLLVAGETDK
jgi:thioredoxin-related protein